jgi:hypothetical protein
MQTPSHSRLAAGTGDEFRWLCRLLTGAPTRAATQDAVASGEDAQASSAYGAEPQRALGTEPWRQTAPVFLFHWLPTAQWATGSHIRGSAGGLERDRARLMSRCRLGSPTRVMADEGFPKRSVHALGTVSAKDSVEHEAL